MSLAQRARFATPLHARTAELCTTNAWTEECGFTVPAVYTSLAEEQAALTTGVALSDLSARQTWLIDGTDAAVFLSRVTLADADRLGAGQTARTLWCDDNGHVRGEGMIARFAEKAFELSTPVRDFAWFADAARGFDAKVTNATGSRAVIGLRGPLASHLLVAAGLSGGPATAGDVERPSWRPAQVSLMRDATGDGIELWTHADDGALVWDRLWRAGAAFGVAAAGADTLETARIENAVPRAGVDWFPAHLARDAGDLRTPADLGFTADLARRFNGADALRRTKPGRGQVLIQLSAEEPFAAGPLMQRTATVGSVTSTAWSHARALCLGLAWIDDAVAHPGATVTARSLTSEAVSVEIARRVFAQT